mgnify:CR=1 FL=1
MKRVGRISEKIPKILFVELYRETHTVTFFQNRLVYSLTSIIFLKKNTMRSILQRKMHSFREKSFVRRIIFLQNVTWSTFCPAKCNTSKNPARKLVCREEKGAVGIAYCKRTGEPLFYHDAFYLSRLVIFFGGANKSLKVPIKGGLVSFCHKTRIFPVSNLQRYR